MTAADRADRGPTLGPSSRFDCVIFDCDGVLVDSEPIVNRVLNEMLNELGIAISLEDSTKMFLGRAVREELHNIERMRGAPLPENWLSHWLVRRNQVLEAEVQSVPYVREAVAAIAATGMPVCVASGADRIKVKLQLTRTGWWSCSSRMSASISSRRPKWSAASRHRTCTCSRRAPWVRSRRAARWWKTVRLASPPASPRA